MGLGFHLLCSDWCRLGWLGFLSDVLIGVGCIKLLSPFLDSLGCAGFLSDSDRALVRPGILSEFSGWYPGWAYLSF
jgi:hypothetical protein